MRRRECASVERGQTYLVVDEAEVGSADEAVSLVAEAAVLERASELSADDEPSQKRVAHHRLISSCAQDTLP